MSNTTTASQTSLIGTLQQETLRLLTVQQMMLNKLLEDPDLLAESDPTQTLDRKRVRLAREMLEGEAAKVENFEMVLAVVGTMKAGKSTCINAIVGTEVLPNRSEPMTAIPTLIRHVRGMQVPELRMQNPEPINQLIHAIKSHLADPNVLKRPALIEMTNTPDGQQLIASVQNADENRVRGKHRGPDEIFTFLKHINDLVRLSNALGMGFPFDEYNEMDEYPVIEVEFFHLRDQDEAKGRFTILDTPGPNEAGHPHLKVMLQDQLKKASALLAVVDYTQVKSEADTDVRDQLLEIISLAKSRVYVLINKYDQKDRNDTRTIEQLCAQVSQDRLSGKVPVQFVFPVSARRAYLSNRALSQMAHENALPNPLPGWAEDFAVEAFGASWEPDELRDAEDVIRQARKLWDKSKFQSPIDAVVHSSYEQAELMSMEAAGHKLESMAKTLSNLLEVREGGLQADVGKVQALIRSLSEDSASIGVLKQEVEAKVKKAAKDVGAQLQLAQQESTARLTGLLNVFFERGKSVQQDAKKRAQKERKERELALLREKEDFKKKALLPTFGKFLFGMWEAAQLQLVEDNGDSIWNPNDLIIKVPEEDRSKIEAIRKGVGKETASLAETVSQFFTKMIGDLLRALEHDIRNEFQETGSAIKSAVEAHTQGMGINIDFQLPALPTFEPDLQLRQIVDGAIREKQENEERSRKVKRESAGGWFKRGFGSVFGKDEWGYDNESYTITKTILTLDMGKLREKILSEVQESFTGLGDTASEYLNKQLREQLSIYFNQMDVQVKQLQGDLARSLGDREKEKASLTQFMKRLRDMKSKSGNVLNEAVSLVGELKRQATYVEEGAA